MSAVIGGDHGAGGDGVDPDAPRRQLGGDVLGLSWTMAASTGTVDVGAEATGESLPMLEVERITPRTLRLHHAGGVLHAERHRPNAVGRPS